MDLSAVNYLSVFLAAFVGYAIGAVYYMVLGKPWMKAARLHPAAIKMRISPFIISFIAELFMAFVLYFVLDDITFAGTFSEDFNIVAGVTWSLIIWTGFMATIIAVNHRYQGFGWDLTIIDAVHWLLVIVAMGAIIGWFGPPDVTLS